MDALELQAALVKLDPATTVTPIGSNVKIVPPHHRIAFAVDIDESNLTLENATLNDETSTNSSASSRKLHNKCSANLSVPAHQNHQNTQQIGVAKCNMAEVR
ncbi:uncharacterized protein LOC143217623 [Lasioglossum baleicum]|uniref:uncharacterized protein LOC143217623 n=1 Tax=Lasioglossum baleicum TaxID=434251 RepID=UPI003FCEB390